MTDLPAAAYFNGAITNQQAKDAQDATLAFIRQLPGAQGRSTLTIASGTITPNRFVHAVDTEGAAGTDDLTTIDQTNLPDGSKLLLYAANGSRDVVVKHNVGGTGKIVTSDGADFTLDDTAKWIMLIRNGTQWDEIDRGYASDFAAFRTKYALAGTGVANTFSGAQTINALLNIAQDLRISGDISPSQLTANTDDWNPTGLSTCAVIRFSTDASRNITGIQGGADGRSVYLLNVGSNDAVLVHDATSTAANRFLCPNNANFTLKKNQGVFCWYDSTSSRWRVIGPPSGALVPLLRVTGAQSSYDFTSVITSAYRSYMMKGWIQVSTDDTELNFVTSTDNGSSYDTGAGNYDYQFSALDAGGTNRGKNSTSATAILMASTDAGLGIGNASNERWTATIEFENPSAAGLYFTMSFRGAYQGTSGQTVNIVGGSGSRRDAADVDAVRIVPAAGTIADGDMTLWGIAGQ